MIATTSTGRLQVSRQPALQAALRLIDRTRYPDSDIYTRDQIYADGDAMAPGGLFLAGTMAATLDLKPGDTVLDLACGRGDSAVFLAREYGVRVVAVDLWISATDLATKFERAGVSDRIVPMQLDANAGLPFAQQWFDAIFCMQAFHSFGGSVEFIRFLVSHLRNGGRFCIGQTCFNEEPTDGTLPDVFGRSGGWDTEYERYHCPDWWRSLFDRTGVVEVLDCAEIADGQVMWEDQFLYSGERAGWSQAWLTGATWLADQLVYGQNNRPYLTHLIATVEKRPTHR